MTKKIIVFTRYPLEGKVKTRLIPELGALGATLLQKEMTELCLYQALELNVPVQIHYNGASQELMQDWIFGLKNKFKFDLQGRVNFETQVEGELGYKMEQSFRLEFERLFQENKSNKQQRFKVILTGCDCPENRAENFKNAFDLLETAPCVFGPSEDGGYYLVGLACNELLEPEKIYQAIFKNIPWGTSAVLAQSFGNLQAINISSEQVALLNDVDVKADISPKISIIVPTLNEAKNLERLAKNIYPAFNYEVIVVDGGSTDQSIEKAKDFGFSVIQGRKGRSAQLLCGVEHAQGEILFFLHADSVLPKNWDVQVRDILKNPENSLGYFLFEISEEFFCKKSLVNFTNFRAKYLKLPYGDQGLFVRKKDFVAWNLPEVPILEDVFLVKKAVQKGKIVCTQTKLETSGRRWLKHGVFKTTYLNHLIMFGAKLNMDLNILKEAYGKAQNPFLLYLKKKFFFSK